jgi:hypothetical protein
MWAIIPKLRINGAAVTIASKSGKYRAYPAPGRQRDTRKDPELSSDILHFQMRALNHAIRWPGAAEGGVI